MELKILLKLKGIFFMSKSLVTETAKSDVRFL
jgi:hypothetical protein